MGSDLSFSMVKHASERYSQGALSFAQLDIADVVICAAHTPTLMADLLPAPAPSPTAAGAGGFNKVFSFYCLHWVPEQRCVHKFVYRHRYCIDLDIKSIRSIRYRLSIDRCNR